MLMMRWAHLAPKSYQDMTILSAEVFQMIAMVHMIDVEAMGRCPYSDGSCIGPYITQMCTMAPYTYTPHGKYLGPFGTGYM